MLARGDRVIAGVSGGADSVCLLHLLVSMREELELRLLAVHVHHGLRGAEADRDARFTEALAAALNVPCRVVRADAAGYAAEHGMSAEEAGRVLRYQIFAREASPGDRIAVAHHRDDQAETILHHLFRGSGLKGLSGMAPVSGAVIRPLLCVERREILDYLAANGLTFCEDSTNASGEYTRNRIRRMLSEVRDGVNERAAFHIAAFGETAAAADRYLERETDRVWAARVTEEAGRCGIGASVLRGLEEPLDGYVIRRMICRQADSAKDISAVHVRQIRELAEKETGKRVCLPYGLFAVRVNDMLWIGSGEGPREEPPRGNLRFSRFPYEKNGEIPREKYTKWFDYDKINGALSVRTRQPGDYITIGGGGRKSVKSFLIDEKVPRQQRDRILLLAEGHHVLWIVGYRISEYYKVTDDTKEVLQVRADKGEDNGR